MSTLLNDYLLTKNITFEPICIESDSNNNVGHMIQFNFPDGSKTYWGKFKRYDAIYDAFIEFGHYDTSMTHVSFQDFEEKFQNYGVTITCPSYIIRFHFNNTTISFFGSSATNDPLDIHFEVGVDFLSYGVGINYYVKDAKRVQIDQIITEPDKEDGVAPEPFCVTI